MRLHPITGMPLEDGHGALKDDMQALVLHVPHIRRTQGDAVADAMARKIKGEEEIEAAKRGRPKVYSLRAEEMKDDGHSE